MELKAAEEKAVAASNPELLEVKERLDKLEVTVKEIVVKSKEQLDDAIKTGREDSDEQKQAAQVEPDNTQNESVSKTLKEKGTVSSEGKTSELAPVTHVSQTNKKDNKKWGTLQEAKERDLLRKILFFGACKNLLEKLSPTQLGWLSHEDDN